MPNQPNLPASFIVIRSQAGKYYVEYLLSRHGWQDKVVLKIPHAGRLKEEACKNRFLEKIGNWVELGLHPHVESCYGLASAQDASYFVEYIQGMTLRNWVEAGRCSLRSTLSLSIQICHGLEHIHNKKFFPAALSPDTVSVTSHCVAKIKDVFFPGPEDNGNNSLLPAEKSIYDCGSLLWYMLCENSVPQKKSENAPFPLFRKDVQTYSSLLFPLLKQCIAPASRSFSGVGDLISALNYLYLKIYGVDCPYCRCDTDFYAESRNNEAVFLFETGNYKEGLFKLQQALLAHDRLSEAVYNQIVYRMRSGLYSFEQIVSMIEAAKYDSSVPEYLHLLLALIRKMSRQGKSPRSANPPFLFCSPPRTLSFYRKSKERRTSNKVIQNHFESLRYEACLQSLIFSWRKKKFGKDSFLANLYERLLTKGDKREIVGVQRYGTIQGQGQPAADLAYLPGTKKIVQTDGIDRLLVRNYGHGTKNATLYSGGETITSLTVSPDGRFIAVGTKEGSLILWQGKTGRPLLKKKVHSGSVLSIDFSFDSRFFASTGEDGLMIFRTLATGREKVVTVNDSGKLCLLRFIPGCLDLVTGSIDGGLKIWSSRGRKCLYSMQAHSGPVASLAVSPKGDFFVSAGQGDDMKIWDRHTGQCLQQISAFHGTLTDLLLLDDNRHLVSSGMDDMIRIWDLVTAETVFLLDGRGNGIRSLSKGAQPHFFFAGQQNGSLLIWKFIYNLTFI